MKNKNLHIFTSAIIATACLLSLFACGKMISAKAYYVAGKEVQERNHESIFVILLTKNSDPFSSKPERDDPGAIRLRKEISPEQYDLIMKGEYYYPEELEKLGIMITKADKSSGKNAGEGFFRIFDRRKEIINGKDLYIVVLVLSRTGSDDDFKDPTNKRFKISVDEDTFKSMADSQIAYPATDLKKMGVNIPAEDEKQR
jgi:hypothetical protein